MKKILVLMLLSILSFSSCITIYEDITVNNDGSGRIAVKIDLGKIGSNLDNQTSGANMSFITQIKQFPESASKALANCKGISNIEPVTDNKKGIYSLALDFKNSRDLNKAIYMLFGQKKKFYQPSFIKISSHQLNRKNIAPLLKRMVAQQQKENNGFSDLIFPFISLKSTYRLPLNVKKVSNIKAITADNKKIVTTDFTLEELLKTNFDFGIRIKF
jgi:hypothetical protein